jgi:lipopolysaccharide export system protein LptA
MSRLPKRSRAVRPAAAALALALALGAAGRLPAETFTYSGDSMSTTLASGAERALLTGNARIQSGDTRITADEIELFGKDFIYAVCRGSVHVVDAKRGIDLTASDLFYNRRDKVARVTGNAVMADLKNEMVVKGGFIEDRDSEGLTVAQIGVRILKKDLVCRAEFARYWRDRKVLELSGMPMVTRKNDQYQAARIVIDLDTEEMSFEGEVKGSLETPEEGGTSAGEGGTGAGADGAAGEAGDGR